METIDITPSWEGVARIMAEAHKMGAPTALSVLTDMGRALDFLHRLALNDDGSLTLGTDDIARLKSILTGAK